MSKSGYVVMVAIALLALAGGASADERASDPAQAGAKVLFGDGLRPSVLPREGGGAQGSAEMDASAHVNEAMLTGFYQTPTHPGVSYSLELLRRGEHNVVTVADPRTWEFQTGDKIRIRLVPNYSGFAYVSEVKGEVSTVVYPPPAEYGRGTNRIEAGRECYVPAESWLTLVDPPGPFVMRVLFKPGEVDYNLSRPEPNPALARLALSDAVEREWRRSSGHKGLAYESDVSYVDANPVSTRQAPVAGSPAHASSQQAPGPQVDRSQYTTNYAVYRDTAGVAEPSIAVEVPVNHVVRTYDR